MIITNRPGSVASRGRGRIGRASAASLFSAALAFAGHAQQETASSSSSGSAGDPGATTVVASAGWLNDWLREQSPAFEPWDAGGQIRARVEHKAFFAVANRHAVDFEQDGDSDNTYFLLRERAHLGWAPGSWFQLYGEMQDAGAYNDDRNPSPDTDHDSLRQAWVGLGNPRESGLTLIAGRQELIYGDQRLIGTADWLNIGRTFDAVKLRYTAPSFGIDGFVSQPVIPDKHEFDTSDSHDRFSGMYVSTKTLVPFQETQLYFLSRNVDDRPATEQSEKLYPLASPRDIYTLGARVKSLAGALGDWDYEAEAAGQLGRFKSSNTSPSLEQQAGAVHVAGGYTWLDAGWSPRLGLEYNYASGNSAANSRTHGTFDNLFPSNHGLYGIMDFFALQNLHDLRLASSVKPVRDLMVRLELRGFWLADTHDYFYQANGAPRTTGGYGINPSAGSYVGAELDLTASYRIARYGSVEGGYGHFFAGDYVKDSLAGHGGARDADYLYAQMSFSF